MNDSKIVTREEREQYLKGLADGRSGFVQEIIEHSPKPEFFLVMFRKTKSLADKETDPVKKAMLTGYSEGWRHALQILKSYGDNRETYSHIINPSIKVEVPEDDEWLELSYTGH